MKSHTFDAASFVLGVLFGILGLVFLVSGNTMREGWMVPFVLTGIGVALFSMAFQRSRGTRP